MKAQRLIPIMVAMLLLATQVFPRMFVLVREPVYEDNGLVCEWKIGDEPFDVNIPIEDQAYTLIDANGVETLNQMSVVIDNNDFSVLEIVQDANGTVLEGYARVVSDVSFIGFKDFCLKITDIENNASDNHYRLHRVDRIPPKGGCSQGGIQ